MLKALTGKNQASQAGADGVAPGPSNEEKLKAQAKYIEERFNQIVTADLDKSSSSRLTLIVIAVIILAAAAGGGYYYMKKKKDGKKSESTEAKSPPMTRSSPPKTTQIISSRSGDKMTITTE